MAEAIEAERLRVEEEARKAATAVYDDSPIVAKAYESATRDETFEDVAALDVVPERPLMQFQLSRPADSIGEPRVFADLSAAVWKLTGASGAPDNPSPSHFPAMTRPSWLGRAARNRHRHAIEQASRRWRGGRRDDSPRTSSKILISTQALTVRSCRKYAPTPGMDRPSKVSMEEGLSIKAFTTSANDPDNTVTKMANN